MKKQIRLWVLLITALVLASCTLQARWMNPTTGRFQTMDSYEGTRSDPQSLHKYAYCHSEPVNNTDPTGYLCDMPSTSVVIGQGIVIDTASTTAAHMVRQYALRRVAQVAAGSLFYALSTETIEKTNDFGHSMRLQLQDDAKDEDHYWSQVLVNSASVGVTVAQVRAGLGAMHTAVITRLTKKEFPMRLEPELYSAIIRFSQKLDPVRKGGGVIQGGNVLRETFRDRNTEYRIDLENLFGHNLRR